MTSSPSAECNKGLRPLPLVAIATGVVVALMAPPPNIAQEVLDGPGLGAARLSLPAELVLPGETPAGGEDETPPASTTTAEPEADPAPPVETASDEPESEADAAAPEPAAGPAVAATLPEVTVRFGLHPTFQRFVFDWPHDVAVVTEHTGDAVVVSFVAPARFRPDHSVPAGQFQVLEPETVTLGAAGVTEIKSFSLADHRVVVDLYRAAPEARGVPAPAPQAADGAAAGPSSAADDTAAGFVPIGLFHAEFYRRDLMIASLLARLEAVERGGPGNRGAALPPPFDLLAEENDLVTGRGPAGPEPAAGPGERAAAPDPDEVERALERTLTRAGVLLLRPGQIELEPGLSYTRRETSSPVLVSAADSGVVFIGDDRVERDEVRASVDLKVGLPFDSQVELSLPFNYVDQSIKTMVGGTIGAAADGSGQAFGNPRFAVAKTLMRERDFWPDLVLRGFWDTDLGTARNNDIPLTGNFNELGLNLSAVKRQDPLAFVGGIGYSTALEKNDIEPGDTLSLSAGAVLAASPSTSLRVAFSQQFTDDVKINGSDLDGSDSTAGVLTIGASVVLGRRALLDVALDVGLNDDAADYALRLALPIRLDLPLP